MRKKILLMMIISLSPILQASSNNKAVYQLYIQTSNRIRQELQALENTHHEVQKIEECKQAIDEIDTIMKKACGISQQNIIDKKRKY